MELPRDLVTHIADHELRLGSFEDLLVTTQAHQILASAMVPQTGPLTLTLGTGSRSGDLNN